MDWGFISYLFMFMCITHSGCECGDDRVILLSRSRWCLKWARRRLVQRVGSKYEGNL